jgi:NTP pyrophosphatase (non-canonical NTP hydrolase)
MPVAEGGLHRLDDFDNGEPYVPFHGTTILLPERETERSFRNSSSGTTTPDPNALAMAVASEAGELLAEYRWIANAQADAWSLEPDNKQRVAMEAADVGIALLLLCDRVGVDLVEAMRTKIALNAQHYPVNESKGRHSRPGA